MNRPTRGAGEERTPGEVVAAVDLGSNSFHMIIARLEHGQLRVIDRLKETVRLAAGLDDDRKLRRKARERALSCLARFGERLRDLPPVHVRAVGTNTLRRAKNAEDFLAVARAALGHEIEVVSGQEEARLIHLAVARDLPQAGARRLIVDIGGGSTEVMVGEAERMLAAHSLFMGCVSYTRRFFRRGAISKGAMKKAVTAARLELQAAEAPLASLGWSDAVGTSGTILAIAGIVETSGWSESGITPAGLRQLRRALAAAGSIDEIRLPGVPKERLAVLPGGVAILQGVFDALGIEKLAPCGSALREGVLYDLVGRLSHDDARDRTIRRLVEQHGVDVVQARRVSETAARLAGGVREAWAIGDDDLRDLEWAALLHEIGLPVSYSGYHKHGAYLLGHAFMPGFSKNDQRLLAALVRGHRRRVPRTLFEDLPARDRERALRLTVLLRLAVLLHRARRDGEAPPVEASATPRGIRLAFPGEWLAERPLTQADLEAEASYLRAAGVRLDVASS